MRVLAIALALALTLTLFLYPERDKVATGKRFLSYYLTTPHDRGFE